MARDATDSDLLNPILMENSDGGHFLIGDKSRCKQEYSLSVEVVSAKNLHLLQAKTNLSLSYNFQYNLLGVNIAATQFPSLSEPDLSDKVTATILSNSRRLKQFLSKAEMSVSLSQNANLLGTAHINFDTVVNSSYEDKVEFKDDVKEVVMMREMSDEMSEMSGEQTKLGIRITCVENKANLLEVPARKEMEVGMESGGDKVVVEECNPTISNTGVDKATVSHSGKTLPGQHFLVQQQQNLDQAPQHQPDGSEVATRPLKPEHQLQQSVEKSSQHQVTAALFPQSLLSPFNSARQKDQSQSLQLSLSVLPDSQPHARSVIPTLQAPKSVIEQNESSGVPFPQSAQLATIELPSISNPAAQPTDGVTVQACQQPPTGPSVPLQQSLVGAPPQKAQSQVSQLKPTVLPVSQPQPPLAISTVQAANGAPGQACRQQHQETQQLQPPLSGVTSISLNVVQPSLNINQTQQAFGGILTNPVEIGPPDMPEALVKNYSHEFDELEVGLKFGSFEEADSYIKHWCNVNKLPLVKRDSCRGTETSTGRILYECPHGAKRDYKSKGMRERRSINFTDCQSRVHIFKSKRDKSFKVTLCNKNHDGHMVGDGVYGSYPTVRKMTDTSQKRVLELEGVGASRRRTADVLGEETGMIYSSKDIHNQVMKIKKKMADGGSLEKYLLEVTAKGGNVNWSKYDSGDVSVLWIQTKTMVEDVQKTRPWLWQCDTTFGTNREGYKVCVMLHKSSKTGRYEVSGLMFLATENQENIQKGLLFFKQSLHYTPRDVGQRFHFMVDKDFNQLEVLHKVFPGCLALLDDVHVDRYFREKVFPGAFHDDGSQPVEKGDLLNAVVDCRLSHTVEDYLKSRAKLMIMTETLNVRPGRVKTAVSFASYFLANWDRVAPMWVYAYRKQLPLQGCGNTQAAEAFFRVIKKFEKQSFGARTPTLHELIPVISSAIDKRFHLRELLVGHKRIKYFHAQPKIQDALDKASWILNPNGLKIFFSSIKLCEARWNKMEFLVEKKIKENYENGGNKTYETDGVACSCSSFKQMFFCRHIIFFRMLSFLPVFDESSFHACLLKDPNLHDGLDQELLESSEVSPPSPGAEMLRSEEKAKGKNQSQSKKFNQAYDVCKELAEVSSIYGWNSFEHVLEATKGFLREVRNGISEELCDYLKDPDKFEIVPVNKCSGIAINEDVDFQSSPTQQGLGDIFTFDFDPNVGPYLDTVVTLDNFVTNDEADPTNATIGHHVDVEPVSSGKKVNSPLFETSVPMSPESFLSSSLTQQKNPPSKTMQFDIAHDSLVQRVRGDGGVGGVGGVGGDGGVGDEADHAGTEFIDTLADVAFSPPEIQHLPVFSQNKQVTARLLMRQALANKAALAAIDEGRIDLAEEYFLRAGELDKMIEVSKGGIGISEAPPNDVSEVNNNMEDSDEEENNESGKVDPFRSSLKRKRQESEDSTSLPEVPYTSMTRDLEEDGKPFQFLNVVRKRGRPRVKREERFKKKTKSAGIELKNYLPLKKMEEMSNPKQRKQRCDKGKKRGSYKVGTQPLISDTESDKSNFPLRAPRAPVSHKALVEEFGESLRPDYCYTCDLPLVYNSSVGDCDEVMTCRKCFSFIHSSCLKNCKYCKDD